MRILQGTDVVQLDGVAALVAALNRAVAGDLEKHDISSCIDQLNPRDQDGICSQSTS